jgi:hypothetical protein
MSNRLIAISLTAMTMTNDLSFYIDLATLIYLSVKRVNQR